MQGRLYFKNTILIQKQIRLFWKSECQNKVSPKRKWIPLLVVMLSLFCLPLSRTGVECKVDSKVHKNNVNISRNATVGSVVDLVASEMRLVWNKLGLGLKNVNGTNKMSPPKTSKKVELSSFKGNFSHNENEAIERKEAVLRQNETTTLPAIRKSDLEITLSTNLSENNPKLIKEIIQEPKTAFRDDESAIIPSLEVVGDALDVTDVDDNSSKEIEVEAISKEIENRKDDSIGEELDIESSEEMENEIEEYDEEVERDLVPSTTPKYQRKRRKSKPVKTTTLEPLSAELGEDEEYDYEYSMPTFPRISSKKHKVHYLKKVPSRLVAITTLATTKRPKPLSQKYKPVKSKPTKPPKMKSTPRSSQNYQYQLERDPHHPHGIVVFDQRPKKPKPSRRPTKLVKLTTKPRPRPTRRPNTRRTTTTTTTEAPTTTSTTPDPNDYDDYYDYYLSSGGSNETDAEYGNITGNLTTISRIPLSKLALAMLASSSSFDNGTDDYDELYYPKTPVNLLNILQAYTKQLQVAQEETYNPPVRIQSQPIFYQFSRLGFLGRIAIAIYYSMIAITPLIYLAFGGIGRLGLQALVGRNLGKRRRRKRSYEDDYYDHYYNGERSEDRNNNNFNRNPYQTNAMKRVHLKQENEDEYAWIIERISEVIWKLSQLSHELETQS